MCPSLIDIRQSVIGFMTKTRSAHAYGGDGHQQGAGLARSNVVTCIRNKLVLFAADFTTYYVELVYD